MCEYTANTSKESFKPSLAIARRVSATCLIPGAINEEKKKKTRQNTSVQIYARKALKKKKKNLLDKNTHLQALI